MRKYSVTIPGMEATYVVIISASNENNALIDVLHQFPETLDSDVIDRIEVAEVN
ncbi:hypothetical protein UFOVP434_88 [uncultured Caudovirales phage]|uniref:Uncharacterized protein n=1 Tax=uncultured Caudovirales phage TaxID=2100421 RepID=A0A6J5MCZ1_9CAUD|nr:hypothetical protein UFOVP434_88 [uncultured Caudovirales phage]